MAPAIVRPRLIEFITGKDTSRVPICSGMTKLISPVRNGMAMKKIMIVPWVLNSSPKWCGDRKPPPRPKACCVRISTASISARDSITRAMMMYMMPMRLWSTLVSHSSQRYRHLRK